MVWKFPIESWMYRKYPTTRVDKMIPRLRYDVFNKPIKIKHSPHWQRLEWGPQLRLDAIAKKMTDLVRDERIETNFWTAWEVRNYTERLITEAIHKGDCHRPTMELADFYLKEKNLIHKLFKVLVPRYLNYKESFTDMHLLPYPAANTANKYDPDTKEHKSTQVNQKAVLELKGNPLPNVRNDPIDSSNFLTNVLLRAARREYYENKKKKKKGLVDFE